MPNKPSESQQRRAELRALIWFGVVILLVLLLDCSASAQPNPAVCRVSNQVRGANNLGSGTLIDKTQDGREGLVLTCAHLFREGQGKIEVRFANGEGHLARIVRIDHEADLAALSIARPTAQPVKIVQYSSGRLRACGYGGSGAYRCAVGNYVGSAESSGQMSLMIDDPVRSGDSGGGVFDDQGRLVAVIWGEAQGVTYASHGKPLRTFLHRVLGRRTSVVYACPNGVCPVRPPAPKPYRPVTQQPFARQPYQNGQHSVVVDPRWNQFQQQIDQLREQKQDRGDYVSRSELPNFGNFASQEDFQQLQDDSVARHISILDRVESVNGSNVGKAAGTAAAGLLGLSGPAGWAVVAAGSIGGWLIGRRVKRRVRGAGGRRRKRFRPTDD